MLNVKYFDILQKSKIVSDSKRLESYNCPAVLITNGIGDGFLALPTLRALSYHYNNLTIIYDNVIFPYWLSDLKLKQLLLIPNHEEFDYKIINKELSNCDLFISFNYFNKKLLPIPKSAVTIGFNSSFDKTMHQSDHDHVSDNYFNVFNILEEKKSIDDFVYPIIQKTTIRDQILKLINNIKISNKNYTIITVHTDTKIDKTFSTKDWNNIAQELCNQIPTAFICIVGVSSLITLKHTRIADLTSLEFDATISLISMSDAFIGIDSCYLHLVDYLTIPSVGIFISTNYINWGFKYNKNAINLDFNNLNQNNIRIMINHIKKKISIDT